jgi:polyketide biosynthesis enoyl-CoA hydratase PksH
MELSATVVQVPPVLNRSTVSELRDALERAVTDSATAVAVLEGRDPTIFCRGLDLAAMSDEQGARDALLDFSACLHTIRMAPKPMLAFVQGEVLAGGVGVTSACDGVLAEPAATFALTELLFGLTPSIILPYVAERVTPQRLRWMAMIAQPVDAEEARRIGLVDRVCHADHSERALRSWIRRLNRLDRDVVSAWKGTVIESSARAPYYGVDVTLDRLRNPNVRDRVRIFLETGEPPWRTLDR